MGRPFSGMDGCLGPYFNWVINNGLRIKEDPILETHAKNYVYHRPDQDITLEEVTSLRCNYVITNDEEYHLYLVKDIYRYFLEERAVSVSFDKLPEQPYDVINNDDPFSFVFEGFSYALVLDADNDILGIFDSAELFALFCVEANHQITNLKLREKNFKRILNLLEDEVFITDEYGFVQFINPRGEHIMGIKEADYLGHHISEMIRQNILPRSLTLNVIDKGERCVEIITLPTGVRIICSAQPVYNEEGKMVQILSTSKNIDEITDKINELSRELDSSNEQVRILQEQVIAKEKYIFESPPMKQVQKMIMKVAPADVAVLIEGESGAGKEVIADSVYKLSRRRDKPFVKINCGMIPKDLMESELFGYEAGAFTGALKNGKIGKLEVADGGTVFFDEIGEMELPLQVKLLEFLQDHQIVRVGGTRRIPLDIRIIAATNRDLFTMVEEGTFRRDLYYRLNVMPIYIPPLRERKEDIAPLIFHFLGVFNKKYGFDKHMDNNVIEKLQSYGWPGNVRELMHTVERIVVASDSDYINVVALDDLFTEGMTAHGVAITANAKVICTELMPLKDAKHELESYLVKMAYDRFGSSYKAAEYLKVNQSTVSRWLKKKDTKKR